MSHVIRRGRRIREGFREEVDITPLYTHIYCRRGRV